MATAPGDVVHRQRHCPQRRDSVYYDGDGLWKMPRPCILHFPPIVTISSAAAQGGARRYAWRRPPQVCLMSQRMNLDV
uniref:Uncharacterized protein n=1 Tax=Leersia perrieri TaxID=77586 RepID=A0A0D9XS99_9ORYZ